MRTFKAILFLLISALFTSCSYTFYPSACEYPLVKSLKKSSVISDSINETSGLENADKGFLTFNDSGGDAALYAFTEEGNIYKTVKVNGAFNRDWEDIAFDGSYIYIADVGNNFGTRDTLTIYKLSADIEKGVYSNETPGIISFSYDEEVKMSEKGWFSHDCEAIFAYGDSIYLFAKDWVTLSTRVYVLPKTEGHYTIKSHATYPVYALITGADIDPLKNEVVLIGYRNYIPVMIKYRFGTDPARIECGGRARTFPRLAGTQVEAVCYGEDGRIYVTAEKSLYKQALYRAY